MELHLLSQGSEPAVPVTLGGGARRESQVVGRHQILDIFDIGGFIRTGDLMGVPLHLLVGLRGVRLLGPHPEFPPQLAVI